MAISSFGSTSVDGNVVYCVFQVRVKMEWCVLQHLSTAQPSCNPAMAAYLSDGQPMASRATKACLASTGHTAMQVIDANHSQQVQCKSMPDAGTYERVPLWPSNVHVTVRPPSSASLSSNLPVCVCRNVNRHKRSQSSPLNLPVDIPEASSGDEEAVGSPGARAREHDSLITEVSHSPCQPLGATQC